MAELGYALMLMFEMQASHLFCFRENLQDALLADLRTRYTEAEIKKVWKKHSMADYAKNVRYELPSEEDYPNDHERIVDARDARLSQIRRRAGWKLTFDYDFGDGWEVGLTLEDCARREASLAKLPWVLEGEGYGIVEDVGGIGGLEELAKALKKGSGREYKEFCDWLDSEALDLESFDIDDMNFRVKKLMRVYRELYEYNWEPTDYMLGILLRKDQGKGSRGY